MPWIRVDSRIRDSVKISKLAKLLKTNRLAATGALVNLWSWAIEHRPDGSLDGLDASDVAAICQWRGFSTGARRLLECLQASGLLEVKNGALEIHDWSEYVDRYINEKNRNIRKKNRTGSIPGTQPGLRTNDTNERTNERTNELSCGAEEEKPNKIIAILDDGSAPDAVLIRRVLDHYKFYHPRSFPRTVGISHRVEWQKIKQRLSEGYSVDDLKSAIDGCHKSAFHMGANDRKKTFNTLELIVRDGNHVDEMIELNDNPIPPNKSDTHARMESIAWLAEKNGETHE